MKRALIALLAVCTLSAGPFVLVANARPIYAQKEKKACGYCHLAMAGAGARGFRGIYYATKNHSFAGFNEKAQAKLAGVKEGAMAAESKPTKPYPPKGTPKPGKKSTSRG
jgi:hypothetical protein